MGNAIMPGNASRIEQTAIGCLSATFCSGSDSLIGAYQPNS